MIRFRAVVRGAICLTCLQELAEGEQHDHDDEGLDAAQHTAPGRRQEDPRPGERPGVFHVACVAHVCKGSATPSTAGLTLGGPASPLTCAEVASQLSRTPDLHRLPQGRLVNGRSLTTMPHIRTILLS